MARGKLDSFDWLMIALSVFAVIVVPALVEWWL